MLQSTLHVLLSVCCGSAYCASLVVALHLASLELCVMLLYAGHSRREKTAEVVVSSKVPMHIIPYEVRDRHRLKGVLHSESCH